MGKAREILKEAGSAEATLLGRARPLEVSVGSNCRLAPLAPVSVHTFVVHVYRCKSMHEPGVGVQRLAFDAFHHSASCLFETGSFAD